MRFKILVFVLALAFLAGTLLAAYWFYDTIDRPERRAEVELENRVKRAAQEPAPDPAAPLFQKAVDALEAGNIDVSHEHLIRLMKVYPASPRVPETRRILGEINLDRLFSRSPMPGKRDYIVKPGDSLARIEKGSLTTIPFLKQLNNLSGLGLQPGDRLVYQPLEFELEVRLADSTLTVRQRAAAGLEPAYFKDYRITAVQLPTHFAKIHKTEIQEKIAWLDGKKLLVTDPKYAFARKRLQLASRPGRGAGLMFRPESDRVAAGAESTIAPEAARTRAPMEKPAGATTGEPTGEPAPAAPLQGIFLADADMEELTTILRVGTPIVIRQ